MAEARSFEEFRHALGEIIERDLAAAEPEASLDEDLELDWVELFEMLLALEELAGVAVDDAVVQQLHTLGDPHAAVLAAESGGAPSPQGH